MFLHNSKWNGSGHFPRGRIHPLQRDCIVDDSKYRPHELLELFFRFQIIKFVLILGNDLWIAGYNCLKPSVNVNSIQQSYTVTTIKS